MLQFLWLVPALPLAGFIFLTLIPNSAKKVVSVIGVGSVALSAIIAFNIASSFINQSQINFSQILWTWIDIGDFKPAIGFYLDSLSMVMMLVVTFVSFLILLYSVDFMANDEGYKRFFAYMNLFVASMLILVLADNLVLLYLGWEGVGLCSYLLIGFWYKEAANARGAMKAFIVTRIGDVAMLVGIFLLFTSLKTLDIQEIMQKLQNFPTGSPLPVAVAFLFLGGAVGKSAQLPLQVWLPDAMAGPSPVSALIHAATMVTAGVYLIARTNVLFIHAPIAQFTVAVIGAVTLLLAGFSALTQHDAKRVLAYSTISQIGYMFLALGVGAWTAAIFHFMVHAFFKSLLFLSVGVVIIALNGEHDIFKMGGLAKKLPVTFWTFFAGVASLSALPFITAGFYSKDLILQKVWSFGGPWLWAAGIIGAFITCLYSFRLLFIIFFGQRKTDTNYRPGFRIYLPLIILASLSLIAGFVNLPSINTQKTSEAVPQFVDVVSIFVSLTGVYAAYILFYRRRHFCEDILSSKICANIHQLWFYGWGFDWLYKKIFVQPYFALADFVRNDLFDYFYTAIARINLAANYVLSLLQTGKLRWYAAGICVGAIAIILILILV